MSASEIPPGSRTRWPGAALFAGFATAVVLVTWSRTTQISNDGVQYVEAARRLLAGDGYSTGILYFDEQYQSGKLPAPQTVWPPGTSLGIAGLAALGMEPESAGRLLARLAFIMLPPLVFLIGLRLTASAGLAALCAAWQLGMTEYWMYLASPNSDLPFMAAALGSWVMIPRADHEEGRWLWTSLLAGVATVFRYAGVFLVLAMGVLMLADVMGRWRRTGKLALRPFLLVAPGCLLVAGLLIRNRLVAGDLRGGNTRAVTQPVTDLLIETVRSLLDVTAAVTRVHLGGGGLASVGAGLGLLGLAALGVVAARGLWRAPRDFEVRRPAYRYASGLGVVAGIYLSAMIWTASGTMLTYGSRYLLPIVPILVCLTVFLASIPRAQRAVA
jgi:hypothetical protein